LSKYVDASAIVKLYVQESDSEQAAELLRGPWATGRHTLVEVRRALAETLNGEELEIARERFAKDWGMTFVVELDDVTCENAAQLAESTGARIDALHLGAAAIAGADDGLPVVTFDRRMGEAARSLGWEVLGA
jgi:predicted nucleic acid-binding protein